MISLRNEQSLHSLLDGIIDSGNSHDFKYREKAGVHIYGIDDLETKIDIAPDLTTILVMLRGRACITLVSMETVHMPSECCILLLSGENISIRASDIEDERNCILAAITLSQDFIQNTIQYFRHFSPLLDKNIWMVGDKPNMIFMTPELSFCFARILESCMMADSDQYSNRYFLMKEMLLRLVQTEGRDLIMNICSEVDENNRLRVLTDKLKANYTVNYTIEELTQLLHLSKSQLFRVFKKELDMSPTQYINSLRILYAQEQLCTSSASITEISHLSGYSDIYYFSRYFKDWVGATPTEYRRMCTSV